MISSFSKKREQKLRDAILRGVFEDNLRIVGKNPCRISEKMPLSVKKISLSFFVIFLFILGYGHSLNLPLSQQKQTKTLRGTEYFHAVESPFPQTLLSVDPSDIKAFLTPSVFPLSRTFGLTVKTIMIDPGHGGSQTGTIGKMGTQEKDITLDIAKRLKERLEKHGALHVLLTRDQDTTVPLTKRIAMANTYKADLFISIHVNYVPSRPVNIIETYYFGQPSDDRTLKLAERENADSDYAFSDFKKIVEKIGNTLKYQESKKLASRIQHSLVLNSREADKSIQNNGIKTAPFLVLLGVDTPAVLTEVSCMSNAREESELNTVTHRENIAHYLETGILDYLKKGEASYEAKRR